MNVPPPTPLTGGHFPSKESDITVKEEEAMLDLSRLTFDQVKFKITQEMCICWAKDKRTHISVTTEREIVVETIINPVMIAFSRIAFVSTTKNNIVWLSKEVDYLKEKLVILEQKNL